jgi:tryptophanyl-tRNA synthetase
MRQAFANGIAWGEAKKQLYERVNDELAPARAHYEALMANPGEVEAALQHGALKLKPKSEALLEQVRHAVGLRAYQ